jgi:hypothetical protein
MHNEKKDNATMNNATTHYIAYYKFSNTYLRTPIGVCDRYNLVSSEAEATQFNDLDHVKRHIKIYSEMHLLCETYFEIFEVTVQRTCKKVITKEMALKCVEILAGAYSCQEKIDAKTMLNTYIVQRN